MILYENLFKALAEKKVRYLVAGGFAVNFHQVQRATADLDLIVHLEPSNIEVFVNLMNQLGYQPKLPVEPLELANPDVRKAWVEEKNMLVFSFFNPKVKFETVDVFVTEPKPFNELFSNKLLVSAFGVSIPVLGIDDLISLKTQAGRDKDLFDVTQLRKIYGK